MADTKRPHGVKDYADGWISERTGTDVPMFLKLVYIVFAVGCLSYGILFMNGEVGHETRGVLVQQFNQVTGNGGNAVMWFVVALTAVFAILLVKFAFSKVHDD
jgi:hypothetical protein